MARIAIAGLVHETNTFAPMPTTYEDFSKPRASSPGLLRGDDILRFVRGRRLNQAACGFVAAAEAQGHQLVGLAACSAQPAGQVTENAFERIMALITGDLVDQGPFDAVFVELHGAMVYEGYHQAEEEILRRIRAIVGDIPIVAPLDLHGNITQRAFDLVSAFVGYRTYPHTDCYETGERCAAVMDYLLSGQPIAGAFHQLPFLMPPHVQSTNTEPARSIYAQIPELENTPGIVSASIMMGFPIADVPDAGPSVWAYAQTQQAADAAAAQLYEAILAREGEFASRLVPVDEAIRQAMELAQTATKPVILSDPQDNAGGGGTSDTVWILESLVRQGAERVALGLMYDPAAAEAAHAAGEGAEIELDLGGKLMPGHTPYHGIFKVEKLAEGPFVGTGPMLKGAEVNLGKMARLRIGGVQIAVSSVRTQCLDQSFLRQVGIEPLEKKIIVLKSANHFRADFEPISSTIIAVEAPGAHLENPASTVFHNLRDGVRLGALGPVYHKP